MKENKLGRAILHILTGVLIMILISYSQYSKNILILTLLVAVFLSFLSYFLKIPVINFLLDSFEMKRHKKIFPAKSFIFFIAGTLIVLSLFEKNIALASIAILTFADPASHFVSCLSKKRYNSSFLSNSKNIYGTIAGILIASVVSSFFVPLVYAILASILSMSLESVKIKVWEDYIDDNFFVPLVSGIVIYISKSLF